MMKTYWVAYDPAGNLIKDFIADSQKGAIENAAIYSNLTTSQARWEGYTVQEVVIIPVEDVEQMTDILFKK